MGKFYSYWALCQLVGVLLIERISFVKDIKQQSVSHMLNTKIPELMNPNWKVNIGVIIQFSLRCILAGRHVTTLDFTVAWSSLIKANHHSSPQLWPVSNIRMRATDCRAAQSASSAGRSPWSEREHVEQCSQITIKILVQKQNKITYILNVTRTPLCSSAHKKYFHIVSLKNITLRKFWNFMLANKN